MLPAPAGDLCALNDEAQTRRYDFSERSEVEGITVKFRLTYRGKLPSASQGNPRAKEKHLIRKQIHKQLRVLWQDHRPLKSKLVPHQPGYDAQGPAFVALAEMQVDPQTEVEQVERIADNFARCGYR